MLVEKELTLINTTTNSTSFLGKSYGATESLTFEAQKDETLW